MKTIILILTVIIGILVLISLPKKSKAKYIICPVAELQNIGQECWVDAEFKDMETCNSYAKQQNRINKLSYSYCK